jgi:phenylacetate-CoA ligase
VDPETLEPLPYGQPGELVFTTLTKEGMPLLRYRTRDLCTLYDGTCACGRTSVRMGRILGRTDDMLIIRGINVFPSQVESVILSMPECAPHFLLVVDRVDNLDTLTVQVEVRQEYFAQGFDTFEPIFKLERELAAKLRSVLSINAKVQVKAPGTLERSQGKSKFVIDNRILK